ncbi:argonaute family protein [Artemisia annua]|uniref:Argonaute family protein n=1 Tax=Artemisia annua TaxID=35608 RepID=A0A2U1P509_ARTAN|nr:argonaute family protein [Artemisia annua]
MSDLMTILTCDCFDGLASSDKVQGPFICSSAQPTSTDPERGVIHGRLIRELLISFKKQPDLSHTAFKDGVSEGQFLLNEMDKI